MRILVLGASGMAGHVISLYLDERGFDVQTLSHSKPFDEKTTLLDTSDLSNLGVYLDNNDFDVVINCIALLVKESDENRVAATKLNAALPLFLEQYYENSTTRVIHISSDGVFAGEKDHYIESDTRDGTSFYGRSKALGELENDKDLTLRLSIMGPCMNQDGSGLFHWFMQQKDTINGFTNIKWIGITTIELSKAIEKAIEQKLSGIYHLATEDGISKFDLLQLLATVFDRNDLNIDQAEGKAISAVIRNTRTDFGYHIPSYDTMISEMKSWIDAHPATYQHYA